MSYKFTAEEITKEQQEVFDNMYSIEDIKKGNTVEMMREARKQAISNLIDRKLDDEQEKQFLDHERSWNDT